jgi:N-hydroxyarylamine O-acetyltransferase
MSLKSLQRVSPRYPRREISICAAFSEHRMQRPAFALDAWVSRIGYLGPLAPTLETLRGLVAAHSCAISYESIDVALGRIPRLTIEALQDKMLHRRRGGYCFEQNMLFRAGLLHLGYRVTSLQGRVVRGLPIDAPRAAIHMLLKVHLPEGDYLADVGFGNLAPTAPLLLAPEVEQPTPHETMRFIEVGGELTLQSRLGSRWEHIYRVIPYPRYDAEYEVVNWYTSTHPDAPYRNNIIAARPLPSGDRLTMFNARITRRHRDGRSERRVIEPEEVAPVLQEQFGLEFSDEEMAAILRLVEQRGAREAPHPFFV